MTYNYASADIGELAHQLTLSPVRLRVQQLEGIERLLDTINAEQSYPYEWVCYHITAYRTRRSAPRTTLTGAKLVGDLVTLAEHITRKANLTPTLLGQPVKTHEELAAALGVSTKTIRRWRARGLLGLRLTFPDGVNRLAFAQGSVDRFVRQNAELVRRGASFRQLTEAERDAIVARARELLQQKRLKLHVVARKIAAETQRAVETVRYTLRRWDQSHPTRALFSNDGQPLLSERHTRVWRARQAGDSIEQIAAGLDCPPDEVEQILVEVEARRLIENPVAYIYNELFDAPNADALILETPPPLPPEQRAAARIPRDLPAYLRALYMVPLLSPAQEVDLFRRYNYLKYKAAQRIQKLRTFVPRAEHLHDIDALRVRAEAVKNQIIRANLRLVVSIAKKHVGARPNFFEVVSDGNLSLMRAVEKFDFARGYRFSTYASWAIMKNYARTIPEQHYHVNRYVTGQEELLDAIPDHRSDIPSTESLAGVRDVLVAGLNQLTPRERSIVAQHFGLTGDGSGQTLEELGNRLGVTKERVRQIEKRAIEKLREVLAPGLADLLAD
ncbi:MAG TPA: sigma-70 family RNA polymerase sigma factor [Phycisphaerae bacterium]|jgi:RNA polymerase sigma factor (sigma-70 family)